VAGGVAVFSSDGSNGSITRHGADIDLAAIRDTLRYIENDLRLAPEHARLHAIVELALTEIGRIETPADHPEKTVRTVRFLPLRP
jgi:hypothetical protein